MVAEPYSPFTEIASGLVKGPRCHSTGITGLGNAGKGLMIIGVGPGKDEMRTGRPLTGPTGKLFDYILKSLGTPRSDFYVTNMCCTHIPGKVTKQDMLRCFQRLEQEIRLVRPKLIITLGSEVCQFWTGKSITQARGAVLWQQKYGCWLMPMIQPAALFHDGSTNNVQTDRVSNNGYDIVRDLRKIPEILQWPLDGSKADVQYKVLESRDEVQQALDELPRDGTVIAVDVETNAKKFDFPDIKRDALICIAVSDGTTTWTALAEHFQGCTWPDGVSYAFHNAPFDTSIIERDLGVWLPVAEDTLLKSYSCDERPGYHGLKPLTREFLGAGFYEEKRAGSIAELMAYNAQDAAYTAQLCTGKLAQWMRDEGTESVYRNLLIPATNVYREAQSYGIRVDLDLLQELERDWNAERVEREEQLKQLAYESGWLDHDINVNSWQQLSKLLYQVIGLEGGPSTDKDHLEALSGRHPFVDGLREYRTLQHNYGIYIGGWVNHLRQVAPGHARVHPFAKLFGTATGRRSYENPPVQTVPRPSNRAEKYGRLRNVIIPTSPEYEIAYADYSRAEIYTAYAYSKDPVMWEALQKDYHLETAVNIMHKDRGMMMADGNYREEMRRIAKVVTFGIFYGMEAYTLSKTAEISVWEAQEYIDNFFATNVAYSKFYNDTLAMLERTGEITSLTGRKRRFVLLTPNPRALKQAVNHPIQSTAGDVTLVALIRLHHLLKEYDSRVLFDVHDAIVFEVAKRYRHIVMPLIKQVMESAPFPDLAPDFPIIPTEQYIGESWGSARKVVGFTSNDIILKDAA